MYYQNSCQATIKNFDGSFISQGALICNNYLLPACVCSLFVTDSECKNHDNWYWLQATLIWPFHINYLKHWPLLRIKILSSSLGQNAYRSGIFFYSGLTHLFLLPWFPRHISSQLHICSWLEHTHSWDQQKLVRVTLFVCRFLSLHNLWTSGKCNIWNRFNMLLITQDSFQKYSSYRIRSPYMCPPLDLLLKLLF